MVPKTHHKYWDKQNQPQLVNAGFQNHQQPRTQLTCFFGGWPSILWVKSSKIWVIWVLGVWWSNWTKNLHQGATIHQLLRRFSAVHLCFPSTGRDGRDKMLNFRGIFLFVKLDVSENRGTSKWMIWGYPYFWKNPVGWLTNKNLTHLSEAWDFFFFLLGLWILSGRNPPLF